MKGRLGEVWGNIRYFCASHYVDFFVGMALCALLLLNLASIIPFWIGAGICPVGVPVIYLMMRALTENPKKWKGSIPLKMGLTASELGCLWALALTLI